MAGRTLTAKIWKTIKPWLTWPGDLVSQFLGFIISVLLFIAGDSRSRRVGRFLGSILLIGKRKKVISHVRMVLDKDTVAGSEQHFWQGYRSHIGGVLLELDWMLEQSEEQLRTYIALDGEENLRNAIDRGNGGLLLFNHHGNFGCVAAGLGLRGYDIGMSANRLPFPSMDRGLTEKYEHFQTVRVNAGPSMLLAAERIFRRNGIFAVAADFSVRHRYASWISFGDAEMLATLAPVMFAMRRRAAILPVTVSSTADQRRVLHIHPALHYNGKGTPEESARIMQETFSLLFNQIRNQPSHWWLWDHCAIRLKGGLNESAKIPATSHAGSRH
jgi:lauroyl/myristoyl acyltransferase